MAKQILKFIVWRPLERIEYLEFDENVVYSERADGGGGGGGETSSWAVRCPRDPREALEARGTRDWRGGVGSRFISTLSIRRDGPWKQNLKIKVCILRKSKDLQTRIFTKNHIFFSSDSCFWKVLPKLLLKKSMLQCVSIKMGINRRLKYRTWSSSK